MTRATTLAVALLGPNYPPDALEAIEAFEREIGRRTFENAARIVDQCNRDGPYNAIGAATLIRAMNGPKVVDVDSGTLAWPYDCHDAESCGRHRQCTYIKCKHEGRDIGPEIDAAIRALNADWDDVIESGFRLTRKVRGAFDG